MSSPPTRPRTLALIAVDSTQVPLPAALEADAIRARLRLSDYDRITPDAITQNQVLKSALRKAKDNGGRLHLFGLVSDGGASSSLTQLFAIIDVAQRTGVRVIVHAFLDGMDVATGTAPKYIAELETRLASGVGRIGTVSGRTYGMAPEGRWDRIDKLYRAVMADNVDRMDTAIRGIEQACQFGVPEQFVAPFVVFDYPGVSLVDSALHFNFAPDGARELTQALAASSFTHFTRKGGRAPFGGRFTCMTPYDSSLGLPTLFPRAPDLAELPLDVIGAAGRATLCSARGPASEVSRATSAALRSGKYAFVLADLASPDNAARSRGDAIDGAVREIAEAAQAVGGAVMVLGSRDASDSVPFVYVGDPSPSVRADARVADLAPTVLELLQVPRPSEMDGVSLLVP